MPPRPKYQREDIVTAACDIMLESGINSVVAREVAKKLGTTVAPIFTSFESMEELKEAVYQKVLSDCLEYLYECLDYEPSFKEFGIRMFTYAKKYPNAFQLIFLNGMSEGKVEGFINGDLKKIIDILTEDMEKRFNISNEDSRLIVRDMFLYSYGISTFMANGAVPYSDDELNESMGRMFLSLVTRIKIADGDWQKERFDIMNSRIDAKPIKKK